MQKVMPAVFCRFFGHMLGYIFCSILGLRISVFFSGHCRVSDYSVCVWVVGGGGGGGGGALSPADVLSVGEQLNTSLKVYRKQCQGWEIIGLLSK